MNRRQLNIGRTTLGVFRAFGLIACLVGLGGVGIGCRPEGTPTANVSSKRQSPVAPTPVAPRPKKVEKVDVTPAVQDDAEPDSSPPQTPKEAAPPETPAVNPSLPAVGEVAAPAAFPSLPTPGDKVREPVVLLSAYHAATCIVGIGDRFPEFSLPDEQGRPKSSVDVLSKSLNVVVLWDAENPQGREQFQRLEHDLVKPYGPSGIGVVAINVGDTPQTVTALAAETNATFPLLLDSHRELFAKVAKSRLPRTYLVDREGRILWFDLEYSRSSRRELLNAIHYHFDKAKL